METDSLNLNESGKENFVAKVERYIVDLNGKHLSRFELTKRFSELLLAPLNIIASLSSVIVTLFNQTQLVVFRGKCTTES